MRTSLFKSGGKPAPMTTQTRAKLFPGWNVVLGLVLFAIMTFVLAGISERIDQGPLSDTDVQLSNWLHTHGSPVLTRAMLLITTLGATWFVNCVAIPFLLFLFRQRRFDWVGVTIASVFGGMLLNKLLKYAFLRPRPRFDDPILTLTSYSFPSGHTMAATVLYGVVAAYFLSRARDWRHRALIISVAGFLIALVGFSRIYLGAHYLSDVLAAMAEGLAWLSLCLTVAYSLRRQNQNRER